MRADVVALRWKRVETLGPITMRVVVVGASSGIGRCIGIGLAQRGSDVALLARRHDRLVDAAREAGPGTLAIECDATVETQCESAIEEAASRLGGIDALVYAPGIGILGRIADLGADEWRRSFDTNVLGATLITKAAISHLTASGGTAAYLSSVSASMFVPWPGLAAYIVTKAALDKLVEAWRVEHHSVGFTRVTLGDCAGGDGDSLTEFPNNWDKELTDELLPLWYSRGYVSGGLVDTNDLVDMLHNVLSNRAVIPSVVMYPRLPA
jgi:NAD(P)-dependent dehydrogenase (short-subunit alcohol dehydrogenase family)